MKPIRVGTAQFEARDGDKAYNLDVIARLTTQAKGEGAELVCFHECSIGGYTYLETLDRAGLDAVAEEVPEGPSMQRLIGIAREVGVSIGAGLIERADGRLYNTYAVVSRRVGGEAPQDPRLCE